MGNPATFVSEFCNGNVHIYDNIDNNHNESDIKL